MVVEDVRPEGAAAHRCQVEALEHIANRPIAHHVLDSFQAAQVDEVIVVSSEAAAQPVMECVSQSLHDSDVAVRHVAHPGTCDLADALRLVAPVVADAPCIVHTANGLMGEPIVPFLGQLRSGAPDATVFVHQGSATDGHLNRATQQMLHLAELDPEHAALGLAGVWILGPHAIQLVADASWRAACDVDLTGVADRITGNDGRFQVHPVDTWCSYAGDSVDLLELNRIALDKLQTELRQPYNNGNRIEGRVLIHEDAIVRSSVIVGPAVIGPGAGIADAYIGPYTSIGANAKIEGAEIERSIISSGASIMHIGGRIASSVVGRNARVFRDFSLPRALRLRVGDGAEVALY
jgi:glucose-1-phosphate thymidylyltransferase